MTVTRAKVFLLLVLKQLVASDRDASHGHAKDARSRFLVACAFFAACCGT